MIPLRTADILTRRDAGRRWLTMRPLNELRCTRCRRLLARWRAGGAVEIETKCPRCDEVVTLRVGEVRRGGGQPEARRR